MHLFFFYFLGQTCRQANARRPRWNGIPLSICKYIYILTYLSFYVYTSLYPHSVYCLIGMRVFPFFRVNRVNPSFCAQGKRVGKLTLVDLVVMESLSLYANIYTYLSIYIHLSLSIRASALAR